MQQQHMLQISCQPSLLIVCSIFTVSNTCMHMYINLLPLDVTFVALLCDAFVLGVNILSTMFPRFSILCFQFHP